MKILTTAGFSVLFLGRRLSSQKWRSLVQLVLGVVLVSYGSYQAGHPSADCPEVATPVAAAADSADGSDSAESWSTMVVGYGAVLIEVSWGNANSELKLLLFNGTQPLFSYPQSTDPYSVED